MKIYNGDFEILDSGALVSPDLSDTRFIVSEIPYMVIVLRIKLSGTQNGINHEIINDNTLAIVFTNPNGLGIGPVSPIRVGMLNGKPLYVMFRVSMRGGNTSYALEYTFYRKDSE